MLLGNADPKFLEHYHVTHVDERSHSQFLLQAESQDSLFEQLNLKFIGDQPRTITLRDSLGQTTDIQLASIVMNAEIDDSAFEFVVPDGIDVIDDR